MKEATAIGDGDGGEGGAGRPGFRHGGLARVHAQGGSAGGGDDNGGHNDDDHGEFRGAAQGSRAVRADTVFPWLAGRVPQAGASHVAAR